MIKSLPDDKVKKSYTTQSIIPGGKNDQVRSQPPSWYFLSSVTFL